MSKVLAISDSAWRKVIYFKFSYLNADPGLLFYWDSCIKFKRWKFSVANIDIAKRMHCYTDVNICIAKKNPVHIPILIPICNNPRSVNVPNLSKIIISFFIEKIL